MSQVAKLFVNGHSQAVRLPVSFRFNDCKEVYVRRDPLTQDVILSRKPDSWDDFFTLADSMEVPEDFMRDREHQPPQKRKLF
jgi:antitoxin VapB